MSSGYSAEQAPDGTGMDADLIPWLEREWGTDLALSEFPYFQYSEEGAGISAWMDQYGCDDIWSVPPRIRESATYRTDVVAVRVDQRALDRREREVGHLDPLIRGEGWGKRQPNLRAFLNFRRDGPMTREYYVRDHGSHGEPNSQGRRVSDRAVTWLLDHGFLADLAPDLSPAVINPHMAAVHAVELKREPGEWLTALEQAARADVYAGYRWVCMSERTVDQARENTDAFRERGVGLVSVSSRTGGAAVHVQPEKTPHCERSYDLLSRPHCERWNLNERTLRRLTVGETP